MSSEIQTEACHFCNAVAPREEACELGWIPYFYQQRKAGEDWVGFDREYGPACPGCAADHLIFSDSDGEYSIK